MSNVSNLASTKTLKPNQFTLPSGVVITERPILYQTEMVRATMEDRKTDTRRTKSLESINDPKYFKNITSMKMGYSVLDDYALLLFKNGDIYNKTVIKSPYGKPGDLLYVRENFKLGAWREDGRMAFDYMASPELTNTHWCRFTEDEDPGGEKFNAIIEKASDILYAKGIKTDADGHYHWEPGKSPLPWKPSIHMPKAASRSWMMVEEVRVERLQDIINCEAQAEGVEPYYNRSQIIGYKNYLPSEPKYLSTACLSFSTLWISINGLESYHQNPWVRVVKFRVLSKTGRPSDQLIADAYEEVVNRKSEIVTGKEADHV